MPIRTLLYHDVVEDGRSEESGFESGDAAIYKLTPSAFDAHLNHLERIGRSPLLASGHMTAGWMLTFDDGGASALDVIAPALERRGWRAHFFMTTGRLGAKGFLDAGALRALEARGHIVGTHSHSHPLAMSSLSTKELLWEWMESSRVLHSVLGARPIVASIPGGAYSAAVAEAADAAGIRMLFTSEPRGSCWRVGNVVCYPRYSIWRDTGPEAALRFVEGSGAERIRQRIAWDAKKLVKWSCGPVYRELRRRLLANAGGVRPTRETAAPPSR